MKKLTIAIISASLLVAGIGEANAAAAPKTGSTCVDSGAVYATSKTTSVCQLSGTSLKWSKPLPVSVAKLSMADAWIKSAEKSGMMPMSAAFGTFINQSSKPVNIIAAYASKSVAPVLQLHEVVMAEGAMKMQQKAGGFKIPAKGTYQLKPGADHTMIMNLAKDIVPGTIVSITYVTDSGARFTQSFLAKVYAGGNETYDPTPASTADKMFSGSGTGQASKITVTNPLIRFPDMMSPMDMKSNTFTTGGFMVIKNSGTEAAVLTGGTSDYGNKEVRIDETVGSNQWTPMTKGLTIQPGASVKLRMKGYHITLTGVAKDVKAGQKVNLTLEFSDGSRLPIVATFMVIPSTDPIYGFATN